MEGQDNSKVSLWSYDMKNGKTVALEVPVDSDGYYPRIKTSPDANSLIVYTMNRHQDDMRLYAVDPFTGKSRMLIKESVPKFVKEEVIENSIAPAPNADIILVYIRQRTHVESCLNLIFRL